MDGRADRFHEANILLTNTLRQLDEVMSKGNFTQPQNSLSSSIHGRINGFSVAKSPSEDYKNGNQRSAFTLVDSMSNPKHDFNANHASDPAFRCSDPSTTWEDNGNKDTDSMAESSTGDSGSIGSAANVTMDKFIKAIELDKLPAPDSNARYKILKWIYDNNGDESLSNLLVGFPFQKYPLTKECVFGD